MAWKGEPGAAPVDPAVPMDLTKLGTAALVDRLGDSHETVRRLAMEELVERVRGDATVVDLLRRTLDAAAGPFFYSHGPLYRFEISDTGAPT